MSTLIHLFPIKKKKRKSSILLAIFIAFISPSFGQGWETIFPADTVIGATGNSVGLEVEEVLDGGYLMAGDVSYPTGDFPYLNLIMMEIFFGRKHIH